MKFAHCLAVCLCVVAFFAALQVTNVIFEGVPHIEDEMAYVWQARVIARGQLTLPSPPCPSCFMVPFVLDYQGQRFGKYPIGWPVALAFGELLSIRSFINPLLAALCIWLTYRLGRKFLPPAITLFGCLLMTVSPFFLMNAGSLLSHLWSLFLSLAFTLAWMDTFVTQPRRVPRVLTAAVAVFSLGVLALTRPLTAVGVALPFIIHALRLFIKQPVLRRLLASIALGVLLLTTLLFAWQFAVTGSPFTNPYTLWWPIDRVGFGPGIGVQEGGYMPDDILANLSYSLYVGLHDFYGWPYISLLFFPIGAWLLRKDPNARLSSAIFPALIGVYCLYWVGSWITGPRYFFEGLPGVSLCTAAGIAWAAGVWPKKSNLGAQLRLRFAGLSFAVLLLIACNLCFYLPDRLSQLYRLYNVGKADLAPFRTAEYLKKSPAVVAVPLKQEWTEYGRLLEISSPFMDTPFVFIINHPGENLDLLTRAFPDRKILLYSDGRLTDLIP